MRPANGIFAVAVAAVTAVAITEAAVSTPIASRSAVALPQAVVDDAVEVPGALARTGRKGVLAEPAPATLVSSLPSWRSRGGGGSIPIRGVVSLAGGVLAHLVLGTLYCWGNLISYAPESLLYYDGLGTEAHGGATADAVIVMPITIIFQCVGLKVGGSWIKKFGPKLSALMGCALMASGVFLSSFQTRLVPFMLCYSVMVGIGIGTAYNAPIVAGWSWFPQKKGAVNGVVLTGFGAGGFIFNMIGTKLINPEGFSSPFPPSVSESWPNMLRTLAAIYAAMSIAGSLLIKTNDRPVAVKASSATQADGMDFTEAITSKRFIILWSMILATATPVLNMANMYKKFATNSGSEAISSDVFQSLMGGLGALFNGVGRLFWGAIVDVYGFEKPYSVIALLEAALLLLLPRVTDSKALFGAVLCGIFFCLGGNFVVFPTVNAKLFGVRNAPEIYSVLFTGFAVAAIGGAEVTKALLGSIGWGGLIHVMTVCALFGLVLLNLL